jgi:hypothetical protein
VKRRRRDIQAQYHIRLLLLRLATAPYIRAFRKLGFLSLELRTYNKRPNVKDRIRTRCIWLQNDYNLVLQPSDLRIDRSAQSLSNHGPQSPLSRMVPLPIHDPGIPPLLSRQPYTPFQLFRLHVPVRRAPSGQRFADDELVKRDPTDIVGLKDGRVGILTSRVEQELFAGMVLVISLIVELNLLGS